MNRRHFIKNTAMAATLVGIAPSAMAGELKHGKKKKVIFVFRGVSLPDGEAAFKKFNTSDSNIHFQPVFCASQTCSHIDGFNQILGKNTNEFNIIQTQHSDRFHIHEIIEDVLNSASSTDVVYLHHTEIGHSSEKLYKAVLEDFFVELSKHYNPKLHRFIVTADIGRNSDINSCGGKDHSNSTCQETFAIYIGGKASALKSNIRPIQQYQILEQKF